MQSACLVLSTLLQLVEIIVGPVLTLATGFTQACLIHQLFEALGAIAVLCFDALFIQFVANANVHGIYAIENHSQLVNLKLPKIA